MPSTCSFLSALALGLTASAAALAGNPCDAILKDGAFEVKQYDRSISETNVLRKYFCTVNVDETSDEKAATLGFAIRFYGFKIGLGKADIKKWQSERCTRADQAVTRNETERVSLRVASEIIVDAWNRCMAMTWSREGWGLSRKVEGTARDGARITFRIALLGQEYHWDNASDERVMLGGRPVSIADKLASREWAHALISAKDILAVGTASCGIEVSKIGEVQRAFRRGLKLRDWINTARPIVSSGKRATGILNLGIFEDPYCAEGSKVADLQRPILIVLVVERPDGPLTGIDYRHALIDAARADAAFRFSRYSNFDVSLN